MKRVLHVAKYYYPFRGGTEQITQDCVNCLADTYEQKVICFNHEPGSRIDEVDGIQIVRVGCFAKIASQSLSAEYGRQLKHILDDFRPDMIFLQYPNPFATHFLLRYCNANVKLCVFWQLDIVKQKILRKLFAGQNRRLLERADLVLASSPNYIEGSAWLQTVKEKCRVVPNCINPERLIVSARAEKIAAKLRSRFAEKTICFAMGRHTQYKGLIYLVRASRLLDDRFVICIGGKGEETSKLKREAQSDPKIHFLGEIDDDTMKGFMLAMDIFCFPSITKNEAFGIALAEGMYYEKPAVTFTIPGSGVNYVCRGGMDGLEVENRDVGAYAQAMIRLAEDPQLRSRLGQSGKKRVEKLFLLEHYRHNIQKVADELSS